MLPLESTAEALMEWEGMGYLTLQNDIPTHAGTHWNRRWAL